MVSCCHAIDDFAFVSVSFSRGMLIMRFYSSNYPSHRMFRLCFLRENNKKESEREICSKTSLETHRHMWWLLLKSHTCVRLKFIFDFHFLYTTCVFAMFCQFFPCGALKTGFLFVLFSQTISAFSTIFCSFQRKRNERFSGIIARD